MVVSAGIRRHPLGGRCSHGARGLSRIRLCPRLWAPPKRSRRPPFGPAAELVHWRPSSVGVAYERHMKNAIARAQSPRECALGKRLPHTCRCARDHDIKIQNNMTCPCTWSTFLRMCSAHATACSLASDQVKTAASLDSRVKIFAASVVALAISLFIYIAIYIARLATHCFFLKTSMAAPSLNPAESFRPRSLCAAGRQPIQVESACHKVTVSAVLQ